MQHLEPYGVTLYRDYDQMLEHSGLEAVVVSTVTTVHAEQAIKAIERGLHVLCEKPLSTSVKVVRPESSPSDALLRCAPYRFITRVPSPSRACKKPGSN